MIHNEGQVTEQFFFTIHRKRERVDNRQLD